ncbi:hypothetical protein NDU88_009971 [Pleurodeles waltl]|uniref:Uncharacterized protein n=1 Tax=Pleurodeles waltl TaxID=8319 RepID=A0AAV7RZY9_PLEWA|nr:hypothetical protein NDU88_009971 [Pleurodeles waltl]
MLRRAAGEGPVPRPRPPLAPLRGPAAPPRLWGRTPLSPRERRSPDPAAAERQETPGGLTMRGEPPGFPQTGRKALCWVVAAERWRARLSAPPSWTRPPQRDFKFREMPTF